MAPERKFRLTLFVENISGFLGVWEGGVGGEVEETISRRFYWRFVRTVLMIK